MTDFDFDIQDDLQIDENFPQADNTPRPPLPGNYRLKITSHDFRRDKEGNITRWKNAAGDPTYPVFNLKMAEITDPFDYARKVGVFTDVPTYPNNRDGKVVSAAADLLVAIDSSVQASNTGQVISQLSERLGNEEFVGRIDYVAYDKDAAADAVAALGPNADKKAINKAYRAAELRGWTKIKARNAQRGNTNLPLYKFVAADGSTILDCQPKITFFYPQGEVVTLGPDKKALEAVGK